jgi:hypothetical protein
MARVCLPKEQRDKILSALKSGELKIADLYGLKSTERNAVIEKYVGKDLAHTVNSRFEQAMSSKQRDAMVNWVKDTTSLKAPVRRDMLKKVERIKETLTPSEAHGFLSDLAETKLGIGVTEEEAKTIITLKNSVDDLKSKITEDMPVRSNERMAYGLALDNFKNYVGELKLNAQTLSGKERLQPKNYVNNLIDFGSTVKSLTASLDNSFIGRQGIKTLLRGDYKVWIDSFGTSLKVFGKELFRKAPPGLFSSPDDAIMSAIRADIYSRPNALNGKYAAAKNGYGLGQFHEEAFPTSIPARIPFLGRFFKASETAFTASALKMRAELADAIITNAEQHGIDVLDETQASALGSLVGSLTGRGELTTFAASGRLTNALMFSPRFLKSNFNTLTAHTFDKTMTPFARKQAALSTLKIASSVGALLTIADTLNPGSVEWDPRSSNFGKIKIGNHRYDITGGMAGLVTLASRLTTLSSKSTATGAVSSLTSGEYGKPTAMDTVTNFFEGKFSPLAGAVRDIWKGQKFSGEKPTVLNTISGLTVPISLQTLDSELKKGNDDILLAMIAESLGFSSTDSTMKMSGKKWTELEKNKGTETMNKAMKTVTTNFNKRAEKLQSTPQFKKLSTEKQAEALNKIKEEETKRVLGSYGIK